MDRTSLVENIKILGKKVVKKILNKEEIKIKVKKMRKKKKPKSVNYKR